MKDLEKLIDEAKQALSVAADCGTGVSKEDADRVAQMLLAHANEVVALAKRVAIPHKLELMFFGATLRYPEDCAASYEINEPPMTRVEYERWYRGGTDAYERYLKSYEESQARKRQIEPKFLGDGIWMSSENCSDQGFAIFRYDDFTFYRGGNYSGGDERG